MDGASLLDGPDFDFEEANSKFDKAAMLKELGLTEEQLLASTSVAPEERKSSVYNKGTSFFDNLSNDTTDKAQRGDSKASMRRDETKRNSETFFGETGGRRHFHTSTGSVQPSSGGAPHRSGRGGQGGRPGGHGRTRGQQSRSQAQGQGQGRAASPDSTPLNGSQEGPGSGRPSRRNYSASRSQQASGDPGRARNNDRPRYHRQQPRREGRPAKSTGGGASS